MTTIDGLRHFDKMRMNDVPDVDNDDSGVACPRTPMDNQLQCNSAQSYSIKRTERAMQSQWGITEDEYNIMIRINEIVHA